MLFSHRPKSETPANSAEPQPQGGETWKVEWRVTSVADLASRVQRVCIRSADLAATLLNFWFILGTAGRHLNPQFRAFVEEKLSQEPLQLSQQETGSLYAMAGGVVTIGLEATAGGARRTVSLVPDGDRRNTPMGRLVLEKWGDNSFTCRVEFPFPRTTNSSDAQHVEALLRSCQLADLGSFLYTNGGLGGPMLRTRSSKIFSATRIDIVYRSFDER